MSTTFVYVVEDEPCVGDVTDLARCLEGAYYSGFDVERIVWTFEGGQPKAHTVKTTMTPFDSDDYATLTVSLDFGSGIEQALRRIDGRA